MQDKITVSSQAEKTLYIKEAFALLKIFSTYKTLEENKNRVILCTAHLLNNIRESVHSVAVSCNYIHDTVYGHLQNVLQSAFQGQQFVDYQNNKELIDNLKADITKIDESIVSNSASILAMYGIDINIKNIRDNSYQKLEAKSLYSDIDVIHFIYGDQISEQETALLKETSKTFTDTKSQLYTADSSFNKRLYTAINALQLRLESQLELYKKITQTLKVYELAEIIFEKEAQYKTSSMLSLIGALSASQLYTAFSKYVEVGGQG